jgi:hypothetical protein
MKGPAEKPCARKDLRSHKNLYFVRGAVMLRASQFYAVSALLCHLASE